MCASEEGHTMAVKLLLTARVVVNATDKVSVYIWSRYYGLRLRYLILLLLLYTVT
jgi:hypothetical protein